MKKIMDYFWLVLLFTIIYIILSESYSLLTIGLGITAAITSIILTNKILEVDYAEIFHINIWIVLTYFWIILRDTYLMGYDLIKRIFTGKIEPNFINYKSELNDEFLTVLLANAITMPPGAITVDREGHDMTILTVGYEPEEFTKTTNEKIEKLLKRFDVKKDAMSSDFEEV